MSRDLFLAILKGVRDYVIAVFGEVYLRQPNVADTARL
jgi:hypothetical protein